MNLISGVLSGVLAVTGGLGITQFSEEDTTTQEAVIQEQVMDVDQMRDVMDADEFEDMELHMEDGIINFGQVKAYMSDMHPELNTQELRELYKNMHGTGGSSQSTNFTGMGMHQ